MFTHRIESAIARLATCLVLAVVPALAGAAPKAAPAPVIESAGADDEMAAITIRGKNFGPGMPAVSLAGKPLQALTNDGTTLTARLPKGTKAGAYVVTLKFADGRTATYRATLPRAPVAASPKQATGPVVESAGADPELSAITIRGKNLGKGMPTVSLAGQPLQVLTFDGTTLTARLKPGTAPGRYLVAVTRTDGVSTTVDVALGR